MVQSSSQSNATNSSFLGYTQRAYDACIDYGMKAASCIGESVLSVPFSLYRGLQGHVERRGMIQVAVEVSTLLLLGGNFIGMGRIFEKIETPTPTPVCEEKPTKTFEWIPGGVLLIAAVKFYFMLEEIIGSQTNYGPDFKSLNDRMDGLSVHIHRMSHQQRQGSEQLQKFLQPLNQKLQRSASIKDVFDRSGKLAGLDLAGTPRRGNRLPMSLVKTTQLSSLISKSGSLKGIWTGLSRSFSDSNLSESSRASGWYNE